MPVEPKYALLFSVGAGGKIVDAESGFECASQCEIKLGDALRATYEVVPDRNYQFAGWSGDICNTPNTYDNPRCNVSVNWKQLGMERQLHIKAQFARSADVDSAGSTEEFKVSSYGFGAFFFPTKYHPSHAIPHWITALKAIKRFGTNHTITRREISMRTAFRTC